MVDSAPLTVTRLARHTPNPLTTLSHPAATHPPSLRTSVDAQLRHWSVPAAEQVPQEASHALQLLEALSKYWSLEHVSTHVPVLVSTGREDGQVRHVSKDPLQEAQSGWQAEQDELPAKGALVVVVLEVVVEVRAVVMVR